MSRLLVDNSVWQRLPHHRQVYEAYVEVLKVTPADDVMLCGIQAAEFGFSARNELDHARLSRNLAKFRDCPVTPPVADVLALQRRIWGAGLVRAVGAADVVIAAHALANDAEVLHYDSDFEHVATVEPRFRHRWIIPRGSL